MPALLRQQMLLGGVAQRVVQTHNSLYVKQTLCHCAAETPLSAPITTSSEQDCVMLKTHRNFRFKTREQPCTLRVIAPSRPAASLARLVAGPMRFANKPFSASDLSYLFFPHIIMSKSQIGMVL